MPSAYLLIQSAPNKTLELCTSLKQVKGVVETYTLLNECDFLAKLEWSPEDLAVERIIDSISQLDGILRIKALPIKDYAK